MVAYSTIYLLLVPYNKQNDLQNQIETQKHNIFVELVIFFVGHLLFTLSKEIGSVFLFMSFLQELQTGQLQNFERAEKKKR